SSSGMAGSPSAASSASSSRSPKGGARGLAPLRSTRAWSAPAGWGSAGRRGRSTSTSRSSISCPTGRPPRSRARCRPPPRGVRAGEMAQRVPKGPIYLNVALEHMLHDWTPPALSREVPPAPSVQPRQDYVATVAELLRNAKNPIIVTETAGRDPQAFSALVELADL